MKALIQLLKDHDRLLETKAAPAEKLQEIILVVLGIGIGFSMAVAILCK
jgi:predicted phosphoribosyltransferase